MMNTFTQITTEKLILRKMRKSDGAKLFEYRSLPEVGKYQGWIPGSIIEAEGFIAKYDKIVAASWMQLAITTKEDDQLIGDCGMHFIDEDFQTIEIGFSLDPAYQRKGYATEAVKGLLNFIFYELKSHRVYGSCDPDNAASINLMERIGMRKEAHFKKSLRFKGYWADDVIYAILDEEWITK